jgi:DNA repair protein SbcC/Rad50
MPASAFSPPTIRDVEEYLRAVLPEHAAITLRSATDAPPFLILEIGNVVSCFAFAAGQDLKEDYATLYSAFKQSYSDSEANWQNADIAFVFCTPATAPTLDQFRSRVETDVFFCRKFVIALLHPLGSAFARLPFLPLAPLHGPSLRPASAQTLLQRVGVPAALARDLVVQNARSADGIVQDCLTGMHGAPLKTLAQERPTSSSELSSSNPIQLSTITIENFRAYRKPHHFNLGTDITVLYGPNGFGKTSFFDAIDFAATGGIGRLRTTSDSHFEKAATHLDSDPSRSKVSLTFKASDGTIRSLTRTVADRRRAILDDEPTDRKAILTALTGGGHSGVDRIDNLVNLFRATHLFSQEQQELTRDFQDDCRLSGEIVSRLLAFEDYANAVNKVSEVLATLRVTIERNSEEKAALLAQLEEDQREIAGLSEGRQKAKASKDLESEISATAAKLATAGVNVSFQGTHLEQVRNWRATLERRIADCDTEVSKLSALAAGAANALQILSERSALAERRFELEVNLRDKDAARSNAELARRNAQQSVDLASGEMKAVQERLSLISWVREQKSTYARLLQGVNAARSDLKQTQSDLDQWTAGAQKAQEDFTYNDSQAREFAGQIKGKQDELSELANFSESLSSIGGINSLRRELTAKNAANTNLISRLQAAEREIASGLNASRGEEETVASNISAVAESQSELRKLLTQLQSHIADEICPLCGDDHGSKEKLILRVQSRLSIDLLGGLQGHLDQVRQRSGQLSEQLAENKREQRSAQSASAQLEQQNASIARQLSDVANMTAALGLDTSSANLEQVLAERTQTTKQEIAVLRTRLQEAQTAAKAFRDTLTTARSHVVSLAVKIPNLESSINSTTQQMNRIQSDPRLDQIGLGTDDAVLTASQAVTENSLLDAQAKLTAANTDCANRRNEADKLSRETSLLKSNLASIRSSDNSLLQRYTQFVARLSEANLAEDTSSDELMEMVSKATREKSVLESLNSIVSNLELALDATTTAAAYARLRRNIRSKRQAVSQLDAQRSEWLPWEPYFSDLSDMVSSQQNRAIELFTRTYGPRTSVIQQRLRSVYGFDDVEISSEGSEIVVRVSRGGEELRPTDFFSQSQQQTLLLGLFLTACSSQNWSSFMPIFLDDPVTHFDDLNTYALLDLIAGLIDTDMTKRQFILSTCDSKLFDLARQKFRYLGKRATFYRFDSIGSEGPSILEINPTPSFRQQEFTPL